MTYFCSKFIAIHFVLFLREENKRSIVMDRDITHYRGRQRDGAADTWFGRRLTDKLAVIR